MKSWKIGVFGLVIVLLFGLFAVADDPVTITLLHAMKPTHQEPLLKLIADFMAEYPYITVEPEYGGYYGDVEQKVMASVVAGNPPTIAQLYENVITPLIEVLVPIGPALPEEERADILDGLVDAATVNGIMYSVPFNKSIMVLYYRKDLIDTPPTTWKEFRDLAAALTVDTDGDGSIDRWGTVIRADGNPELFLNYLTQAGGTILNEDWSEVTINNEVGLQAMEYSVSLAPYAIVDNAYESDYLKADQVCMYVSTSGGAEYNYLAAESIGTELGVALAPAGPVNNKTMIQGANFAVFDRGQTEAQKEAGVLFCRFMLRPENTVYWAIEGNYLPVTKSGYADSTWEEHVANDSGKQVMSEAMLNGFGPLNHANYSSMRLVFRPMYEEAMLLESTPQQALDDAAAQLEDLLEY